MIPIHFVVLLFAFVDSKPRIQEQTPPALALINILPDYFLKFFFNLRAAEKSVIEDLFLDQADRLTNEDEKTRRFIEKIKENDPKLGVKLHEVIEELTNKTSVLSDSAKELFDLFLVKPNVNQLDKIKKFTQLRLRKWVNLPKQDKKELKKVFPEITNFFEILIHDKQVRDFADFKV